MIKYFFLFLFLFSSNVMAQMLQVKDIRLLFHQATNNEEICTKLINTLNPYNEDNNPLYLGYRGGAVMLMAKHAFNPFSKLSYFKKGKSLLERAIKAEDTNVELRFLRYTIQTSVPGFLNYSGDLKTDRQFLKKSLTDVKDLELKKIISSYLLKHP